VPTAAAAPLLFVGEPISLSVDELQLGYLVEEQLPVDNKELVINRCHLDNKNN
jgi:hypothetical protein